METPTDWNGRVVFTMDVLLLVRERLRSGLDCKELFEDTNALALRGFYDGFTIALGYNNQSDAPFSEFLDWLRDVKHELPGEGWPDRYLSELGGDHERAIKKFLDFVSEFVDAHPLKLRRLASESLKADGSSPWRFDVRIQSSFSKRPEYWRGKIVHALDMMYFLHQWVLECGSAIQYLAIDDIHVFEAYLRGYTLAFEFNKIPDEGFEAFKAWLLKTKKQPLTQGWSKRLLLECDGDHVKAIQTFLRTANEYIDIRFRERIAGK